MRVLQWNVFEDGLTDAPGSLGFSSDFDSRFSTVLGHLCRSGSGSDFRGFGKARDFTQLPPVGRIDSTSAFFSFIDVVYCALYHSLGGEARFGAAAPGDAPNLGNSLRTLFLHSAPAEPAGSPSAPSDWRTPRFEEELEKILAPAAVADRVRSLRDQVFVTSQGVLSWDRASLDGVWKRDKNVWRDKWLPDLSAMIAPPPTLEPEVADALSKLIHVARDGGCDDAEMTSLIGVTLGEGGEPQRVRTFTLQASVRWLLVQMCRHSADNVRAGPAVAAFAGLGEAPESAEARADALLPEVLQAVGSWFSDAVLASRHAKVCRWIERLSPDVATLVEFDEQWRRHELPTNRRYAAVSGKGTASVVFDSDRFERVEELDGVKIAQTIKEQHKVCPKSSCVVLLRSRSDSALVLVAAVHLESAPPSDGAKVQLRAGQLRATLSHLSETASTLAAAGHRLALVLGGDFNALPEEFLHGNGDDFWQAPGVERVRPRLKRPAGQAMVVEPPDPPLAIREGEDAPLRLRCDGCDGGELRECSGSPGAVTTRAGANMVIDFVFVGSAGGLSVEALPFQPATAEQHARAADKDDGIYQAVMAWGSDHLPVASDVYLGAPADVVPYAGQRAVGAGGERKGILHTVLFRIPDVSEEVYAKMQETIARLGRLEGVAVSLRPAGAPGLSLADTLSGLEWPDKTEGYTHCMNLVADDVPSLKAYLHSSLHREEWVGHMGPAGAHGPPLVFDSELALSAEAGRIQHVVLFKLPGLPGEVYERMQETVGRFNEMAGVTASFRPAGAPGMSFAETLAALEWPDKASGYTHCLHVIADDMASLKAYLHSDLHKDEWVGHMKPAGATCPPLVFDTELAFPLRSAL